MTILHDPIFDTHMSLIVDKNSTSWCGLLLNIISTIGPLLFWGVSGSRPLLHSTVLQEARAGFSWLQIFPVDRNHDIFLEGLLCVFVVFAANPRDTISVSKIMILSQCWNIVFWYQPWIQNYCLVNLYVNIDLWKKKKKKRRFQASLLDSLECHHFTRTRQWSGARWDSMSVVPSSQSGYGDPILSCQCRCLEQKSGGTTRDVNVWWCLLDWLLNGMTKEVSDVEIIGLSEFVTWHHFRKSGCNSSTRLSQICNIL